MSKYKEIFGTWSDVLIPFTKTPEFKHIKDQLKKLDMYYPAGEDIFRAFKLCPYEELKAVILTTNPYLSKSDGLAFSSRSTPLYADCPAMLKAVLDAVEQDVGRGLYLQRTTDLSCWAEQGVLLLNLNLTNSKDKFKGHLKLWEPFIDFVFKRLSKKDCISYVFVGDTAEKHNKYLNPLENSTYYVEHPMSAIKEGRPWRYKNIFSSISAGTKFINDKEIIWT